MVDNTITLALEGDVSLQVLSEVMSHFNGLLNALAQAVVPEQAVEWIIEDMQAGSALLTVAGEAETEEPVLKVIEAYAKTGRALERREPIPFPTSVARAAAEITRAVGEQVRVIRFETATSEATIYGNFDVPRPHQPTKRVGFGVVKGRVQAISSRGKLRFNLYDSLFDKPISCYLQSGQEDLMREIWGKRVYVSGQITRDADLGRAVSVRHITAVDTIPEYVPGSYKQARGVLTWSPDDEPAEILIRRLRDGESV
jgi:hypothetical protein